jgi:uncharacterized protein (TIGR00730 family)
MVAVKRLCVYCGSAGRVDEVYRASATRLGVLLGRAGIELVYGGGRIGLMGLLADAALASGGKVIGVIPHHLNNREVGHRGVTELQVVDSMHDRKLRMFELADAIAILPGGLGTLDELMEVLTWKQLGLHDKPIILVDVWGYWEQLRSLIDHIVAAGFAERTAFDLYRVVSRVEDVLPALGASAAQVMVAEPKLL